MTAGLGECGGRRRRTPVTLVRGTARRAAGGLALGLAGASLVWVPPAHGALTEDPLTVTLTSLSPASIPRSGPVVITGRVHNGTDETWRDVRVYPLFSAEPITDADTLAEAARSDPLTSASGSRLTGEGQFQEISSLAPGQAAGFRISLPRRELEISGDPGVYWVGAQALGTDAAGRDLLADGRARSFMPLVPRNATAEVAVVAPLRQRVERDVRTRVVDPEDVAQQLAPSGRLGRVLDALGSEPDVSWLVDPALLDAAADLADNNPPLSMGQREQREPGATLTPSPATPSAGNAAPAPSLDETMRQQTEAWLQSAAATLARSQVLALPYADTDALALLRGAPDLVAQAHRLALDRLEARGVTASPAIAPPARRVDLDLVERAADEVVTLADAPSRETPPVGTTGDGHRVLLPQSAAVEGGPGPGNPHSALALRQRIVSEAALAAIAGADDPLLVALPDDWDPGARWPQADFLQGLQAGWLDLVPVPDSSAPASTVTAKDLPYTPADRRRELDEPLLGSAAELVRASGVLADLLASENNVALRLRGMAMAGVSYSSRGDQPSAASLVTTLVDTVNGLTDRVSVVGTEFVTLSGGSGTITVSLINELAHPVRIGLDVRSRSGSALAFEETEPVTLQPQQRTTMRLQVRTSRLGVNEVTITPVTQDDRLIGTPLEVTVRSSEVGQWFWSVMVGAGAVLVVMIGKRIRDRIKNRRWRRDDHPDPDGPRLTESAEERDD